MTKQTDLCALGKACIDGAAPPAASNIPPIDEEDYLEQLRAALGLDSSAAIPWGVLNSATSASLSVTVTHRGRGSNVSDVGREVMPAQYWQGIWDITYDRYERTVSFCSSALTLDAAREAFTRLISKYCTLLGSDRASNAEPGVEVPTIGGPLILALTVRDTAKTRLGQLFTVGGEGLSYDKSHGNTPAEGPYFAIMVRLYGEYASGGKTYTAHRPLSVYGFPDAVVDGGRYLGAEVSHYTGSKGPVMWHTSLLAFLAELTKTSGEFGFMGQDPTIPKFDCFAGTTSASGYLQMVAPDATWVSGDWVKLTNVNQPGLTGTYKVRALADQVYEFIKNRPPAGYPLPTSAVGRLMRTAEGVPQQVFYRFRDDSVNWTKSRIALVRDRKAAARKGVSSFHKKKVKRV